MNKSKQIALGAMITVFSIILMFMTSILATAKISLIALTSFLISVLVIEAGVSTAITSFISTSILSSLLVPNKLLLVPYISFFGYYGILKSYIEKSNNFLLEWIIKIVVFNVALSINYFIIIKLFITDLNLPLSIWIIALGLQIMFIVYDYVFSLFIDYYNTKLKRYIK